MRAFGKRTAALPGSRRKRRVSPYRSRGPGARRRHPSCARCRAIRSSVRPDARTRARSPRLLRASGRCAPERKVRRPHPAAPERPTWRPGLRPTAARRSRMRRADWVRLLRQPRTPCLRVLAPPAIASMAGSAPRSTAMPIACNPCSARSGAATADGPWLGRGRLDAPEHRQQRIDVRVHELNPDDADMHVRIGQQDGDAALEQLRLGDELAGDVDRVRSGAEARDGRAHLFRRRRRGLRRELKPSSSARSAMAPPAPPDWVTIRMPLPTSSRRR